MSKPDSHDPRGDAATNQRRVRISKFLSRHLRHAPQDLDLVLQPGGWVPVPDLLAACARHGLPITLAELIDVVENNPKQRFSFDREARSAAVIDRDPDPLRIRANQGHSVEVDLQLAPLAPPATLFHGTGAATADAIAQQGLRRMSRQHVHLSVDVATARAVGARHGRPVIFSVQAGAMHQRGHVFYCSDNGVWLVDEVPPEFLQRL